MPTILEPSVELWSITPDAQHLIERCGRICWKSEDKLCAGSDKAFIKMLKSKKHISVIEHAVATFFIRTDRGISHEIVRHRLASYSQESTRYCVAGGMKLTTSNPRNCPTIEQLFNNKSTSTNGAWKRVNIRQLNEKTGELQFAKISDIVYNGTKPTVRLTTRLGYVLEVTKDHEILAEAGYQEAGSLKAGDKIAVNGTEKLYTNKAWLRNQYVSQMKSAVQIAAEHGFTKEVIKRWVRVHKLPRKPLSYHNRGRAAWNKGLNETDDARVASQAAALRKHHWNGGHPAVSSPRRERVMKPSARTSHKLVGEACEICDSLKDLQLHHNNGDRDRNDDGNHTTVCRSCHGRVHSKNLKVVHYDTILKIESAGNQKVYDITMAGKDHNFVANGVVVHNCNYGKKNGEIFVIQPSGMPHEEAAEWWEAMKDAERHYLAMLKIGSPPQRARSVLPTCTKTDIAVTMNFRSWLNFISLRAKSPPAHPDIAPLAQAIQRILVEKAQAVFAEEASP